MMKCTMSIVMVLAAGASAYAASFDCDKAATIEENTICADPRLSAMDSQLGKAFGEAKKSSAADKDDTARLMAIARVFFTQRKTCGASRACLIASYAGALDGYRSVGSTVAIPAWVDAVVIADGNAPASRALPKAPGQCVTTQVTAVHPRLGDEGAPKPEDYDSGTGIEFTNGGYQVSYSREPALIGSRKGDNVVMCLISVPQRCPKGDDRGKSYTVTNLRTKQTWTMGDSQHMCGGA